MIAAKDVIADFLINEKELDILDVNEVRDSLDGSIDIYGELETFCDKTKRGCPSQNSVTRYFKDKYNMINRRTSTSDGLSISHYYKLEKA